MLQSGHSDRVLLGTPIIIRILSLLLRSRLGAQEGLGNSPRGRIAFRLAERLHAAFETALKRRAGVGDMGRRPPE
jgi:hypothetical protein